MLHQLLYSLLKSGERPWAWKYYRLWGKKLYTTVTSHQGNWKLQLLTEHAGEPCAMKPPTALKTGATKNYRKPRAASQNNITVIITMDFQCPHCARLWASRLELQSHFGVHRLTAQRHLFFKPKRLPYTFLPPPPSFLSFLMQILHYKKAKANEYWCWDLSESPLSVEFLGRILRFFIPFSFKELFHNLSRKSML